MLTAEPAEEGRGCTPSPQAGRAKREKFLGQLTKNIPMSFITSYQVETYGAKGEQ